MNIHIVNIVNIVDVVNIVNGQKAIEWGCAKSKAVQIHKCLCLTLAIYVNKLSAQTFCQSNSHVYDTLFSIDPSHFFQTLISFPAN